MCGEDNIYSPPHEPLEARLQSGWMGPALHHRRVLLNIRKYCTNANCNIEELILR